jgi:hypothetical protein
MKLRYLPCLALVLACWPGLAPAESLRCEGGSVAEGDTRLSLLYKCGPPSWSDQFCAPVYFPGGLHVVPEPWASTVVPCQVIDQWLYERGPGEFVATVFLRGGVVQSIRYSRVPQ